MQILRRLHLHLTTSSLGLWRASPAVSPSGDEDTAGDDTAAATAAVADVGDVTQMSTQGGLHGEGGETSALLYYSILQYLTHS